MPSDAAVARLRSLDTCAVSDALDQLGLPGTVIGIHRGSAERRIAGRVIPVKLGPAGEGVPAGVACCQRPLVCAVSRAPSWMARYVTLTTVGILITRYLRARWFRSRRVDV